MRDQTSSSLSSGIATELQHLTPAKRGGGGGSGELLPKRSGEGAATDAALLSSIHVKQERTPALGSSDDDHHPHLLQPHLLLQSHIDINLEDDLRGSKRQRTGVPAYGPLYHPLPTSDEILMAPEALVPPCDDTYVGEWKDNKYHGRGRKVRILLVSLCENSSFWYFVWSGGVSDTTTGCGWTYHKEKKEKYHHPTADGVFFFFFLIQNIKTLAAAVRSLIKVNLSPVCRFGLKEIGMTANGTLASNMARAFTCALLGADTKENGQMAWNTARASRFGLMEIDMMGNGAKANNTARVSTLGPMGTDTKANGRMETFTERGQRFVPLPH